jgi:hypothetical protein
MDVALSSGSESGPLVATILADALLEQSWIATAPETWFAAPLIVSITCALALSGASICRALASARLEIAARRRNPWNRGA